MFMKKFLSVFLFILVIILLNIIFADDKIKININELREKARTHNYALFIGINEYHHWNKLNNAVKDAEDIINLLRIKYGFSGANIIFLKDNEATRKNIILKLEHLASKLTDNDNLFLYYI